VCPSRPGEHRQQSEHGLGLGRFEVGGFAAVAGVPADDAALETGMLVAAEQDQQLERVSEPDMLELAGAWVR